MLIAPRNKSEKRQLLRSTLSLYASICVVFIFALFICWMLADHSCDSRWPDYETEFSLSGCYVKIEEELVHELEVELDKLDQ